MFFRTAGSGVSQSAMLGPVVTLAILASSPYGHENAFQAPREASRLRLSASKVPRPTRPLGDHSQQCRFSRHPFAYEQGRDRNSCIEDTQVDTCSVLPEADSHGGQRTRAAALIALALRCRRPPSQSGKRGNGPSAGSSALSRNGEAASLSNPASGRLRGTLQPLLDCCGCAS